MISNWGGELNNEKVRVQANLYWMEYQDQLVLTGAIDEVGAPIRQNVGESRRCRGLKLMPQFNWQINGSMETQPGVE